MKNILLLTDFSEHARAASESALILSQKLHTNLLLLNTFWFYPTAENYIGSRWYPDMVQEKEEDSYEQLDNLQQQLEEFGRKALDPGDRQPVISSKVEDIGLGFGIADVLEKNKIELVVMGTHEDAAFEKDHVDEIIRNTKLPVLIVPAKTEMKKITEIIYATDYDLRDVGAINHVLKITKAFDFRLKVVHITETGKTDAEREKAILENHLKSLHNSRVSYESVRGKDFITRLTRMIKTEHAGMVAILHHHHSFLGRLFTHSDTRDLLKGNKIPVIVFPTQD